MNSYLPLPRAAPPVEVPGTYQPTGRPAPMRPPVSGMFQPIGPPAAAAPPLLSVADGQLSMVYLAKTVPFSSVAPGTRFVTEPDHPELHKTCMTSFEKDVLQLEIAKLTRQIKDSTTAYDRLNGWYSTMKGEFRTLDSDYQRLNTHHVNLKKDFKGLEDKYKDADDDAEAYRKERNELLQQLKDSKANVNNYRTIKTRTDKELREFHSRSIADKEMIQHKETEIQRLRQEAQRNTELVVENKVLREDIKSLKETNDLMSQAAVMDAKTLETHQKKIEELFAQIGKMTAAVPPPETPPAPTKEEEPIEKDTQQAKPIRPRRRKSVFGGTKKKQRVSPY